MWVTQGRHVEVKPERITYTSTDDGRGLAIIDFTGKGEVTITLDMEELTDLKKVLEKAITDLGELETLPGMRAVVYPREEEAEARA